MTPSPGIPAHVLGQAQNSYHDVESTDHPLELMQSIAVEALADAAIAPGDVDVIGVVDPFSWTYTDLAGQVASGIGCRDDIDQAWLPGGGTTPLDLLHTVAAAMADGDIDVALLVGGEAMRTRRKATRAGRDLPWPPRDRSVDPMRGQPPFTSEWEARHGLRLPIQVFPAIENAIRAAHSRGHDEQIELAAKLLARNAGVAADNPHAWFSHAPTPAEIATVTSDNRMIAYPYTKRMNSIMDVDQAAALVVVSERFLERISRRDRSIRDRAVAVVGGAGAEEVWNPSERPRLADCDAMDLAFHRALEAAGCTADDITAFDFYSCFPSPIQLALDTLGLDTEDERPFTLTGGLAYAGGPGNNYVMHSLATAVDHLRRHPDARVMVTGVGMANTKHAATVLAGTAAVPSSATGTCLYRVANDQVPIPLAEQAEGPATVVTYTIEYDRDANPVNVVYVLDLDAAGDASRRRAVANAPDPVEAAALLGTTEPIGRGGHLTWDPDTERQLFLIA